MVCWPVSCKIGRVNFLSAVKWNNSFSKIIQFTAGVRQGGISSPFFCHCMLMMSSLLFYRLSFVTACWWCPHCYFIAFLLSLYVDDVFTVISSPFFCHCMLMMSSLLFYHLSFVIVCWWCLHCYFITFLLSLYVDDVFTVILSPFFCHCMLMMSSLLFYRLAFVTVCWWCPHCYFITFLLSLYVDDVLTVILSPFFCHCMLMMSSLLFYHLSFVTACWYCPHCYFITFLLSLYVDDVLTVIEKSGLGCFKKNCVNSFMYADDLILLTILIRDLQCLFNICLKEFALLGMDINSAKLCCLRIGQRHNIEVVCIAVNDVEIQWCKKLRYLGLFITSARKFNVNLQNIRHTFFSSLNGILVKWV